MDYNEFLCALIKKRKECGFSQRKLSEKLDISAGQLNNIEKGRCPLKVDVCFKICKALNISPETLMNPLALQNEQSFVAEKMSHLSTRDFKIIKDMVMLLELDPEDL